MRIVSQNGWNVKGRLGSIAVARIETLSHRPYYAVIIDAISSEMNNNLSSPDRWISECYYGILSAVTQGMGPSGKKKGEEHVV